jgi:uncharacterized membrane protein (DUF485 family)
MNGPGRGQQPSRRVRVVLAGPGGQPRAEVRARQEIEEQTQVGEVLVRGLVRAQLGLALRLSLVVAGFFGSLPLLFALAPGVAAVRLFGLTLPWLLLGVLAYPFVIAVAWVYVRTAERNEQDFTELVERS